MGRLEKELERFFNSSKGKKLIDAQRKIKVGESLPNYADKMVNIIKKKMEAHGLGEYADLNVSYVRNSNAPDEIWISYSSSGDAISPSLDPDKYKEGVILGRLMNAGYDANGVIYGYWKKKGVYIKSRKNFEGYHFLEDAVNEFNASSPDNVQAIYIEQSARP